MFFALLRKAIRENFPSGPEVLVVFDGETGSAGRKASRASSDAAW
jgi:DNA polymerase I